MKNKEELMKYDEAIKILKKVEVLDFEAGDLLEYHPDIVRGALNFAIKELENNRWIPVTERLPKEIGDYIVTKIDDENVKVIGLCYFSFWGWTTNKEVTAWMPLPKPYEEGAEE